MRPFGVIILAAGGSSRLGKPKQLVLYHGQTLVERAARHAIASEAEQIVLVVGASRQEVSSAVSQLTLDLALNEQWEEGMSSSIRAGLDALAPEIETVVMMTCDQPSVSGEHIGRLAQQCASTDKPVASSYDGVLGIPCAFPRTWFEKLRSLAGDSGAKELIRSSQGVESITLPGGEKDVDEAGDLG